MSAMKHTPTPWRKGYRGSDIGCENAKIGGVAKLLDVRGWGYLTGTGHGALGLSADEAAAAQTEFTDFVVDAVNAYDKHRALIETLQAALVECEDYFDNRADADCDQDGFIPNEEMKRLQDVRDALAAAKKELDR